MAEPRPPVYQMVSIYPFMLACGLKLIVSYSRYRRPEVAWEVQMEGCVSPCYSGTYDQILDMVQSVMDEWREKNRPIPEGFMPNQMADQIQEILGPDQGK